MNRRSVRLASFYRRLLHLYPPQFRENYLEEMAAVFDLQLAAKGNLNSWQCLALAWRELIPLPGLLIAAYLRERKQKRMKTTLNRWFNQPDHGSWTELALTGVPYLLMGILPGIFSMIPAIKDLPSRYGIPILIPFILVLAGLGIIGLLTNLPRWSLVYAGILIALVPLMIMYIWINWGVFPSLGGWSRVSVTALNLTLFLALHFSLTGLLIWLSGKFELTSGFRQRVESDPSLLALLFYGGTFLIVLLNYDEIASGGYLHMLSSAVLALGAWGYLKAADPRSKLLALTGGLTIAAGVALIANLTLSIFPITSVVLGPISVPDPVIFVGMTWLVALIMIMLPPLVVRYSPAAEA